MEELTKGMAVVKLLRQIMDSMKQNVQLGFKEMNLTGPQGMLVGTLAHHGEMKISDLSERMGLSNSTVSGIVDRLEKQGFVERTRSKEDRRVVYVNVTSEFRKNTQNIFHGIEQSFETLLKETPPEDVDKIFEGLNLLKELMDRHKSKE